MNCTPGAASSGCGGLQRRATLPDDGLVRVVSAGWRPEPTIKSNLRPFRVPNELPCSHFLLSTERVFDMHDMALSSLHAAAAAAASAICSRRYLCLYRWSIYPFAVAYFRYLVFFLSSLSIIYVCVCVSPVCVCVCVHAYICIYILMILCVCVFIHTSIFIY